MRPDKWTGTIFGMQGSDIFRSPEIVSQLTEEAIQCAWTYPDIKKYLLWSVIWGGKETEHAFQVVAEELAADFEAADDLNDLLEKTGLMATWSIVHFDEDEERDDSHATERIARLADRIGPELQGILHATACGHEDGDDCASASLRYFEQAARSPKANPDYLKLTLKVATRYRAKIAEAVLRRATEDHADPEQDWLWWWAGVGVQATLLSDNATYRELWEAHSQKAAYVLRRAAGTRAETWWGAVADDIARLGPDHWGRYAAQIARSRSPEHAAAWADKAHQEQAAVSDADWEGAGHLWRPESITYVVSQITNPETVVSGNLMDLAIHLCDDIDVLKDAFDRTFFNVRNMIAKRIVDLDPERAPELLGAEALDFLCRHEAIRQQIVDTVNSDPATALELLAGWQGSIASWMSTAGA